MNSVKSVHPWQSLDFIGAGVIQTIYEFVNAYNKVLIAIAIKVDTLPDEAEALARNDPVGQDERSEFIIELPV